MRASLNYIVQKYNLLNNKFLIAATFLHTGFKEFYVVGTEAEVIEDYKDKAVEFLKGYYKKLCDQNILNFKQRSCDQNILNLNLSSTNNTNDQVVPSSELVTNSQKPLGFSEFVKHSSQTQCYSNDQEADIEKELNQYRLLQIDSNPQHFWTHKSKAFPILQTLVKAICCAPGSSVSSEREFSSAEYMVWPRRNRLAKKNLEILTLLQRNLDQV
jgi:hypothetical protein